MNLYTKQKQSHEHDYQRGEGGGEKQTKSTGLTDANDHM